MIQILIIVLLLFVSSVSALRWLHLWQIKEYRLDRLLVHFRETEQGKKIFYSKSVQARFLLMLLLAMNYVFVVSLESILLYLVAFYFIGESAYIIKSVYERTLKIPIITPKLILILLAVGVFLLLGIFILPFSLEILSLLLFSLIPSLTSLLIALFWMPSYVSKKKTIAKATNRMEKLTNVTVIGITGSYGKGSVKEYLFAILSVRFDTVKTPDTINTPIGIARTILSKVNAKTDVFIVEMGAYKIGEIASMCKIAKPDIGIITAVNEQHVSLFGSLENTMKAKYELIKSLSDNGASFFNGNNPNSHKLFKKTKHNAYLYGTSKFNVENEILADNIVASEFEVSFDVFMGKEKMGRFTAGLLGGHVVENLLPAIAIAYKLKMTTEQIRKGLSNIVPVHKTMEPFQGRHKTTFVDDTFNANPQSVIAAANYAAVHKGKKIFILQPMIELGGAGGELHKKVGEIIGKKCDFLFLTNNNFFNELSEGIYRSGRKCETKIIGYSECAKFIEENTEKGDVVIFEGKEAQNVLALLKHSAIGKS